MYTKSLQKMVFLLTDWFKAEIIFSHCVWRDKCDRHPYIRFGSTRQRNIRVHMSEYNSFFFKKTSLWALPAIRLPTKRTSVYYKFPFILPRIFYIKQFILYRSLLLSQLCINLINFRVSNSSMDYSKPKQIYV